MNRILCCLIVSLTITIANAASEAENSEARGYNLSMAGALINDWCERQWQTSEYISIHACNYQLAQLYNLDISTVHFEECAAASGGDIVRIADCMVDRFNAWTLRELKESE